MAKLFTEGTLVLAGLTAFLFLMGWSYQAGYFDYFGFSVNTLEQPIYVALVWSIAPLFATYANALSSGVVVVVIVLFFLARITLKGRVIAARLLKFLRRSTFEIRLWSAILSPLILVLILLRSHKQGKDDAAKYYKHPTESVTLTIKKGDSGAFEPQLLSANAKGTLMFLDQSKELILAFVKDPSKESPEGIFIIPRVNLLAVHIRQIP